MTKIQIIGVGALNTDLIYKVERILEDGEMAVDWARSFPGALVLAFGETPHNPCGSSVVGDVHFQEANRCERIG